MKEEVLGLDGHEITVAPTDVIAEYKSILAPVESEWLEEMSGKGLDGQAVLNRAREVIANIDG